MLIILVSDSSGLSRWFCFLLRFICWSFATAGFLPKHRFCSCDFTRKLCCRKLAVCWFFLLGRLYRTENLRPQGSVSVRGFRSLRAVRFERDWSDTDCFCVLRSDLADSFYTWRKKIVGVSEYSWYVICFSFGLVREELGLLTHRWDSWLFKSRPERYVTKKNKKERGAVIGIVLLGTSWIQVLPVDLLSGRATAAALRALLLICCCTCCSYSVISEFP